MPVRFPYHKFLGPGNRAPAEGNDEDPVDVDDYIAAHHDNKYHFANSPDDIRVADREAIHSFGEDFLETGNWHSAVGAAGLGVKYGVESLTGILYPRLGKLWLRL